MEYNLVSADSHMDMSWLPGDLFEKNGPSHLKDVMPKVVDTDEGPRWVTEGRELGVYGGLGFGFSAPKRGHRRQVDKMYEVGYYEGGAHAIDPELRLNDMAIDGVDAEILYGMTTAGMRIRNPEVLTESYRIYNDWVSDFCTATPGRWYALACMPIHDPVLGGKELRRAANNPGIRGGELYVSGTTRPIYLRDGHWDPLWDAAAETGLPISFHIGGGGIKVPGPIEGEEGQKSFSADEPTQNQLAFVGTSLPLGQLAGSEWLISIIMSGACERLPNFRFVLGECGAGWIPFVIERMDIKYKDSLLDEKFQPNMTLLPSEYWYRQGATTFQQDPCVNYMAEHIGVDNLMWGSDYPHPDGVWPGSQEVIENTMGKLDASDRRKITCDNAVNLYRMGQ